MATTLTTLARNKLVDAHCVNGGGDWFSMHSADPGATGANEITTSPRKQDTFPAGVGGETTSAGRTHNVPGGNTIRFYGRWSLATGGVYHSGGPLPADETFGVNGTYDHSLKTVAPTTL